MEQQDQKANERKSTIQEFIDKFENLAEEYKIEKYLSVVYIDNRPIMLWRPKDINEATKTAKTMHQNLYNQVMMAIGEINPPETI